MKAYGAGKGGGKSFFDRDAIERLRFRFEREKVRKEYEKLGFIVVTHGEMKKEFYIDVKAVEAKVDNDFYDRGD